MKKFQSTMFNTTSTITIRVAITSTIALLVLGFFVQGCHGSGAGGFCLFRKPMPELPDNISAQRVKELLDQYSDFVYLDVRTVKEFNDGHVPGSLNAPVMVRDAQNRMMLNDAFLTDVRKLIRKNAYIIAGCRSGKRSLKAQSIMKEAGYLHVTNMLGGFSGKKSKDGEIIHPGWSTLGYPVERE